MRFWQKPVNMTVKQYSFTHQAVSLLASLVVFAALLLTLSTGIVQSGSMYPMLDKGSLIISLRTDNFDYGDVVTFNYEDSVWVKRLIGDSGDTIAVHDGKVWRNGEALEEPYINEAPDYTMESVTVPEGCVFLMGDNRNNSRDSHLLGPFDKSILIGRVFISLAHSASPS